MSTMTQRTATATCPDCGRVCAAKTDGLAAYGLRRHSCDTHRARQERAARVAERRAASGPERPCTHNDRHPHGHRNRYVIDRCRCRPCRDASAQYERDRARAEAYGLPRLVDAQPARDHINALRAQGMGWKRIAIAAGLEPSVLWKLLYGDRKRFGRPSNRITPRTEAAVLAVTLDRAPKSVIDGTGTRRRLQALVAIGWSQAKLGEQIGVSSANFNSLIHGRRGGSVTVARAEQVAALYDRLWDQEPPASTRWDCTALANAKRAARRWGWAPPLAWDDETIDDPTATKGATLPLDRGDIDPIAVARVVAGDPPNPLRAADRVEAVRILADRGLSSAQIAALVGVKPRQILRDRRACRVDAA